MRQLRCWSLAIVTACATLVVSSSADAQSQRGQPKSAFSTADFAKLKWLVGTWEGSAPGEPSYYERYRFANDSTIEISYFADSTLARTTGNGRVYLTVGRIYHTFGPGRWAATHIDDSGVYFVPQANAQNTFAWASLSPDSWTATSRTGLGGHDRITVYQMRRTGKR